ncbi:type II toxin-antitoxin system VapC family toxin [Dehalococcoidales bacterium]|nr:type II toxin-antitoxin system VapC family toxin [Dehalococcoidales bacterium]
MTEQLVVDANIVAKLYLRDERYTDKADLLFSRFQRGEIQLIAPRLITYEVPAAIKRGAARAKAAEKTWRAAISSFESLGLVVVDDSDAKYEATRLAINYTCTYYDALYLLLAEDLGCRFITADETLWRTLHTRVGYLLLLASYK